jgi:hypothetical protein
MCERGRWVGGKGQVVGSVPKGPDSEARGVVVIGQSA